MNINIRLSGNRVLGGDCRADLKCRWLPVAKATGERYDAEFVSGTVYSREGVIDVARGRIIVDLHEAISFAREDSGFMEMIKNFPGVDELIKINAFVRYLDMEISFGDWTVRCAISFPGLREVFNAVNRRRRVFEVPGKILRGRSEIGDIAVSMDLVDFMRNLRKLRGPRI